MQLTFAFVAMLWVLPAGQQSKPDTLRDRIEALVRDLDSDRFVIRRDAREELIEIGPSALPFLNTPDAAAVGLREELKEIRLKLQNLRAVRSLDASKVTLVGDLTVDQIADRLTRLTSNRVSVAKLSSSMRGEVRSVSIQNQEFWPAVLWLSRQLPCGVMVSEGEVRLVPQVGDRSWSIDGAHLVRLGQVERKPLVGQDNKSLLRIPLAFTTEPRLRALFLEASGDRTRVASGGNRLAAFSSDRTLELPVGGRGEEVSWRHDVLVSTDDIPQTVDVQGEVDVLMAAGYERFEFANLPTARRRRQKRMGVTLLINDVEIDEERGNLSLTIEVNWKRSVAAFDSYRTWQFHNEAWLQTSDGKRIDFSGPLRTDGQAGGGVRLTYTFKGVAETLRQCRFMYEAPTALETVKVPFEFKAVPTNAR